MTAIAPTRLLPPAPTTKLLAEFTLKGNPSGYVAFPQVTTVLYRSALPALGVLMTIVVIISLALHEPRWLLIIPSLALLLAAMAKTERGARVRDFAVRASAGRAS